MEDRVIEKSDGHFFFAFFFGVFPGMGAFEEWDFCDAIKNPAKFAMFGNVRLFEENSFFGVEAEGYI